MTTKKKTEVISETEMRQAELNTKKIIADMPKVWVIIAPDEIRHSSRMQELKKQHEEALVKNINMGTMG